MKEGLPSTAHVCQSGHHGEGLGWSGGGVGGQGLAIVDSVQIQSDAAPPLLRRGDVRGWDDNRDGKPRGGRIPAQQSCNLLALRLIVDENLDTRPSEVLSGEHVAAEKRQAGDAGLRPNPGQSLPAAGIDTRHNLAGP